MREIQISPKSINFNRLLPRESGHCFLVTHEISEKLNKKASAELSSQLPQGVDYLEIGLLLNSEKSQWSLNPLGQLQAIRYLEHDH